MEYKFVTGCLDLRQTLESGQCFRWKRLSDGEYVGAAQGRVLRVRQAEDGAVFTVKNREDAEFWLSYFDCGTDYDAIIRQFSADRILKEDLMGVILCGNVDDVRAAAASGGYDIAKAEVLDPLTYEDMDALVAQMVELRRGKMTEEEVRELLKKSNYFGTMLVKMGKADCLLGGATYSTADTVRPALQLIKTKPGASLVSSCMIMDRQGDMITGTTSVSATLCASA